MNIKEAKIEIQNEIVAYFAKDKFNNYIIPIEKQRPVFLIGPPGIGKTAIMEQIASELNVSLLSYSMTHHTRQSAIGLPFIETKIYAGKEYHISEYTMSEIIASVYDMIEQTGIKEGILFLDEVNCVSETLAPPMLQFLQYKVFGRHQVPKGWSVVTAGYPPEYNNSVREFDVVTWDRLKKVEVTPNYEVWKEYAYKKGIHASITTFLDIKKDCFYKIETTVDGKSFVTARGWSDLSDMIHIYESKSIEVKKVLIEQYLQNKTIARDFAMYYDLFNKYKSDYQIRDILNGKATDDISSKAKKAKFDERYSLIGLLLDALNEKLRDVYRLEVLLKEVMTLIKTTKTKLTLKTYRNTLMQQVTKIEDQISKGKLASSLSFEDEYKYRSTIKFINDFIEKSNIEEFNTDADLLKMIKAEFDNEVKNLKKLVTNSKTYLSNVFKFFEDVFDEGQEMFILVSELTISYYGAHFISKYGCDEYFKHNKQLLFHERQKEIINELNLLMWEE